MELVFPEQPQAGPDFDNQTLDLVRHSLSYAPSPASLNLKLLESLIPVFSLSVPDARQSNPLSCAVLTSWKRFVFRGSNALGEVDYPHLESSRIGAPISFRRGALCAGLIRALHRAEKRAETAIGQWEISLLLVEGLQIEALWLREREGAGEWLVPVQPVNRALKALHFYPRDEFECVISCAAEARIAFEDV
jgi:hypothetical protein